MKNARSNLLYLWRHSFLVSMVLSAEMVRAATGNMTITVHNQCASGKTYEIYTQWSDNSWHLENTLSVQANSTDSYTKGNVTEGFHINVKVQTQVGSTPAYSATKPVNLAGVSFTDSGTGGEPQAPWKYHYNVCNNSPYKRTYQITDENGIIVKQISLLPGECEEGDIVPQDGNKHHYSIFGTQYGDDGNDKYGVGDIPTDDPGWYQDNPPSTSPKSDDGKTPPDNSSNTSTNIYFQLNTSELAKEKTLQTVGNVLHSDIVQGLGGVQNGITSLNTKLGRVESKLTSIDSTLSSGFSSVNNSLSSINSAVSGLGGKLDTISSTLNSHSTKLDNINNGINNVKDAVNNFSDRNHQDMMDMTNLLGGIKQSADIIATNTTQTNYFVNTNAMNTLGESIVSEAITAADNLSSNIRGNMDNLSDGAKGYGGTKTLQGTGGSIWTINLPTGGGNFVQLDANPMNSEALQAVVPWIRFVLLWICKAIFVVWCYRIIVERYDSVIHTPSAAQAASGGSLAGKIGAIWTIGKVILRVIAIPALVAILTHFVTSTIVNNYMQDLHTNIFETQSVPVLAGLYLLNWFAPITEVVTMFAEGMSFWFAAMSQSILWSSRIKAAGI